MVACSRNADGSLEVPLSVFVETAEEARLPGGGVGIFRDPDPSCYSASFLPPLIAAGRRASMATPALMFGSSTPGSAAA